MSFCAHSARPSLAVLSAVCPSHVSLRFRGFCCPHGSKPHSVTYGKSRCSLKFGGISGIAPQTAAGTVAAGQRPAGAAFKHTIARNVTRTAHSAGKTALLRIEAALSDPPLAIVHHTFLRRWLDSGRTHRLRQAIGWIGAAPPRLTDGASSDPFRWGSPSTTPTPQTISVGQATWRER
jgi:hypothetical protein